MTRLTLTPMMMNGNLIQKTHKTTKATTKFDWDIENRLIQVTKHESEDALPSETITYAYDALGRRIEKNINGNIKRYVYDNKDILLEFNKDNLFQKFYLHSLGIDDPLAVFDDNTEQMHYYHKDGLGNITSLTDESGNEKEKYVYDAFGKRTIYDEADRVLASSALENPYSFTGREYDDETSLQYHRARYYNPETGIWISEDPIEFNSGEENLYRYALNNPINYFDPDGDFSIIANTIRIGAVVGLCVGGLKIVEHLREKKRENTIKHSQCIKKAKSQSEVAKCNRDFWFRNPE